MADYRTPTPPTHWMLVNTPENFERTRGLVFSIQGMKARHGKKAGRMRPGDRILYYLTGLKAFAATATVTSPRFADSSPVWHSEKKGETYPWRVRIGPAVVPPPGRLVPADELAPFMEHVRKWPAEHWLLAFQGNVHEIPAADFRLVEERLQLLC